jgi:16S rRNA (guanine527-N7)-methyltransferase
MADDTSSHSPSHDELDVASAGADGERARFTALREVLLRAQRLGTLGDRPIDEVIEHARCFLAGLDGVTGRVLDIGTGAGVPGLIIAHDRPDVVMVLTDRRATRMDELIRAVKSLGMDDRVSVVTADVADLARDPEFAGTFDVVVSRGFGPPEATIRAARPFLKNGGRFVVSEPPTTDPNRWPVELVRGLGFSEPQYFQGIAMFHVEQLLS